MIFTKELRYNALKIFIVYNKIAFFSKLLTSFGELIKKMPPIFCILFSVLIRTSKKLISLVLSRFCFVHQYCSVLEIFVNGSPSDKHCFIDLLES